MYLRIKNSSESTVVSVDLLVVLRGKKHVRDYRGAKKKKSVGS